MIAKRLKALRAEMGISKKKLTSLLRLDQEEYDNYEAGIGIPKTTIICLLADYFKAHEDYLLGYTNCRCLECKCNIP